MFITQYFLKEKPPIENQIKQKPKPTLIKCRKVHCLNYKCEICSYEFTSRECNHRNNIN